MNAVHVRRTLPNQFDARPKCILECMHASFMHQSDYHSSHFMVSWTMVGGFASLLDLVAYV
jgi:hypothetical protein